jgi:putative membrane protein
VEHATSQNDGKEAKTAMMWYGPGMGWWGYAGMGIGMVLFWALIIAGIVVLIRINTTTQRSQSTAPPPQALSPEQILSARYAHGEINETEYRERMAVLRDHVRT